MMRLLLSLCVSVVFVAAGLVCIPAAVQAKDMRVIVIDPGHGGDDTGAIGYQGLQEKGIVLNFARRLAEQIRSRNYNYKVYLTRENDKAVPLAGRLAMARRLQADLFISLHADWNADPKVRGFAAYSAEAGATKQHNPDAPDSYMRAYLPSESEALSNEVNAILHDLVAREHRQQAGYYAQNILTWASKQTKLLDRSHRLARFHVLTAPEVPSVLLELGFLTNRKDASNLTRSRWQINLASRIAYAVDKSLKRTQKTSALYE